VDIGRPVPTLLRHHGFNNDEPPRVQREVVTLFVAEVLGGVTPERAASVLRARRAVGEPYRSRLGEPDQMPPDFTPAEEVALAEAVAFAHPPEARREGIVPFLKTRGTAVLGSLIGDSVGWTAC
jgi:hypothetical protein